MEQNNFSLSAGVVKDYVGKELFYQLGIEKYLLPQQCDQLHPPYNGQNWNNGKLFTIMQRLNCAKIKLLSCSSKNCRKFEKAVPFLLGL